MAPEPQETSRPAWYGVAVDLAIVLAFVVLGVARVLPSEVIAGGLVAMATARAKIGGGGGGGPSMPAPPGPGASLPRLASSSAAIAIVAALSARVVARSAAA